MAPRWRSAKGLSEMAGTSVARDRAAGIAGSSGEAAGTGVSAGGAAEKFAEEFNRAVLQSERLRVSIVIGMLLCIMIRWLAIWLFFPSVIQDQLGGELNLGAMGILGLAALIYECAVFARITFGLHR